MLLLFLPVFDVQAEDTQSLSITVTSWMVVRKVKAVGASCPANFVANADKTGQDDPVVRLPAPDDGVIMHCRRSAWKFNVTDIPDNVESIDTLHLTFNVSDATTLTTGVDFTSIETDIETDTPPELWDDIGNGTVFVTLSEHFLQTGIKFDVSLGDATQNLLETVLVGDNEWSVGIKFTIEGRGGGVHDASVNDQSQRITLIVGYTVLETGGRTPGDPVDPVEETGRVVRSAIDTIAGVVLPVHFDWGLGLTVGLLGLAVIASGGVVAGRRVTRRTTHRARKADLNRANRSLAQSTTTREQRYRRTTGRGFTLGRWGTVIAVLLFTVFLLFVLQAGLLI